MGNIGTLREIKNEGSTGAKARATLYYQASSGVGSYAVPLLTQDPPRETEFVAVKQAVRSAVPDANGNIIPAGTTAGLVTIEAGDPSSVSGTLPDAFSAECTQECNSIPAALQAPSQNATLHFGLTSASANAVCAPPACPVPTNFHQTSCSAKPNGVLHFEYEWSSSTGSLADLANCNTDEKVDYPTVFTSFTWPSPPYEPKVDPNPFIRPPEGAPPDGDGGGAGDDHVHPPFQSPFTTNTFVATQNYRYKCPCANNGQWVNMLGPISITRNVVKNKNGTFGYKITKSGCSAILSPIK